MAALKRPLRSSNAVDASLMSASIDGKENVQTATVKSKESNEGSIGATVMKFIKHPLLSIASPLSSPVTTLNPTQSKKNVAFSPHRLGSADSNPKDATTVTPKSILRNRSNSDIQASASTTTLAPNNFSVKKVDKLFSSQNSRTSHENESVTSAIARIIHPTSDNGDRTDAYTLLSIRIRSLSQSDQVELLKDIATDLIKNFQLDIAGTTKSRGSKSEERLMTAALKCLGFIAYHEPLVALFSDKDLSDLLITLMDKFLDTSLPKLAINLITWNLGMQRFPCRVVRPHVPRLVGVFIQALQNQFKSVTIQSEALGGLYSLLKSLPFEMCKEAKTWVAPLLRCLLSKTPAVRYKASLVCSNSLEAVLGPFGSQIHSAVVSFMKEVTEDGQRQIDVFKQYMLDTIMSDEDPKYAVQMWSALLTWHGNNLHNPSSDIKLFLSVIEMSFNRPNTVFASHRAWTRLAHAFARKDDGAFLLNAKRLRLLRQPIQTALALEKDKTGKYALPIPKAKIRLAASVGAIAIIYECLSPCLVSSTTNKEAPMRTDLVWEEFVRPVLELMFLHVHPIVPKTNPSDPSDNLSSPLLSSSPSTTSSNTSPTISKQTSKAAAVCEAPRKLALRVLTSLLSNALPRTPWHVDRIVVPSLSPNNANLCLPNGEDLIVSPEEIANLDLKWIRSHCKTIFGCVSATEDALNILSVLLKSLNVVNQKEIQPSQEALGAIQDICYFASRIWTDCHDIDICIRMFNLIVKSLGIKALSTKKIKWDVGGVSTTMTHVVFLSSLLVTDSKVPPSAITDIIQLFQGDTQQSAWEYLTSMTRLIGSRHAKKDISTHIWTIWWKALTEAVDTLLKRALAEEKDVNPFKGFTSENGEKHPHEEKQWVIFELLCSFFEKQEKDQGNLDNCMEIWSNLLQNAKEAVHVHHRDGNVIVLDHVAERICETNATDLLVLACSSIIDLVQLFTRKSTMVKGKQSKLYSHLTPLPHIYALTNKALVFAYSMSNQQDILMKVIAFIKRAGVCHSRPVALALFEGVSKYVEDEKIKNLSKAFDLWGVFLCAAVEESSNRWKNEDLVQLESIFTAGFQSNNTDIVNSTVDMWNRTFGLAESLTYPPTLKKVAACIRSTANINLPSWPTRGKYVTRKSIVDSEPPSCEPIEPLSKMIQTKEIEQQVEKEFHTQMPTRKRKLSIRSSEKTVSSTSSDLLEGPVVLIPPRSPKREVPEENKTQSIPIPVNAITRKKRRRSSTLVQSNNVQPKKHGKGDVLLVPSDTATSSVQEVKSTRQTTIQVKDLDERGLSQESKQKPDVSNRAEVDDATINAEKYVNHMPSTPVVKNRRQSKRMRRESMLHPPVDYVSPILNTPAVPSVQVTSSMRLDTDLTNFDRFAMQIGHLDLPSDDVSDSESPSRLQAKRRRVSMSQPPMGSSKTIVVTRRKQESEPSSSPRQSPRRSIVPDMIASDDDVHDIFRREFNLQKPIPSTNFIPSSTSDEKSYQPSKSCPANMSIIHEDSKEYLDETQVQVDAFVEDFKSLVGRKDLLSKMDVKDLHNLQSTVYELWGDLLGVMGERMGLTL